MKNIKIFATIMVLLLAIVIPINAQQTKDITGTVTDKAGDPVIGATVAIKNKPTLGVMTDTDGKFSLKATAYDILIFSYIGYTSQEIPVEAKSVINVTMEEADNTLQQVTVVGGNTTVRKATIVGAITTVDTKTLNAPTASISNSLAGNVAGIIARQTSGEPGSNFSEFWIRGISTFGASSSALVLVDGIERNFNEINVEDIESFSVLKDASATAIYGQRGANGVVIITTKRGNAGKVNISFKGEAGYNTHTILPKYVDGMTYANLANEARRTRYQDPLMSPEEMDILRYGLDPDLYPNVDWYDEVLRTGSANYRASLNISGGGETARYFISGSYYTEDGRYRDESLNNYDTNARYSRYNYRTNVDVNVTPSTIIELGVAGWLTNQNKPGAASTDHIWNSLAALTPITVPIMYSNGLIPTYGIDNEMNPYVLLNQTGYNSTWESKIETNVSLKQDLKFITEGLDFVARFAFDTRNWNEIRRNKMPDLYRAEKTRDGNGNMVLTRIAQSYPLTQISDSNGDRRYYGELNLNYSRLFGEKHRVGGMLLYYQQETSNIVRFADVIEGIPRRTMAFSGRGTYGFSDRYLLEFNFGYTGSENFQKGKRFGFFPAIAAGWVISEEPFIKNNISWLDMFKIRYSYGEVGNDKMSKNNKDIRFAYLDVISGGGSYNFGEMGNSMGGTTITSIGTTSLTWEVAKKHNIGLDLNMFNSAFTMTVDLFKDTRDKIFMERGNIPYTTGIENRNPWANIGKMKSQGADGNFSFSHKVGQVDLTIRGNATYTKSEVIEHDEEINKPFYQKIAGYRYRQTRGLVAVGLFKDQAEIDNSPRQTFGGDILPGDIKYKDVNGDGVINQDDEVPIGYSEVPNLIYGMGLSAQWKGFDFNILFQGAGKSDFFVSGNSVYPFQGSEVGNILDAVADPNDRWISREISGTPDTERQDASFPRLSYGGNLNNYRNSTFWLKNGRYLRLKNLEVGYTVPKTFTRKWKMEQLRVFFLGYNLAQFRAFNWWDPELASNDGAKYPIQKTFSFGLNVTF